MPNSYRKEFIWKKINAHILTYTMSIFPNQKIKVGFLAIKKFCRLRFPIGRNSSSPPSGMHALAGPENNQFQPGGSS